MTERRIRNISDDVLQVPLLGVTLEPGDVANIPEGFSADVVFPESYFEVDGPNDGGANNVPADDAAVTEVVASDAASAEEGNE